MKSDVRMLSSSPHKKSFVKISYISYIRTHNLLYLRGLSGEG